MIEALKKAGLVLTVTISVCVGWRGTEAAPSEDPVGTEVGGPQSQAAGRESGAPHGAARAATESAGEGEILARVNGDPVTRGEWERLLTSPVERDLLAQELGAEDPDGRELGALAVRKLIHRCLLLQEAGRRSLTVTEQELDQTITALRRRFEDLEGFGRWMKERGLDDRSLFETTRADILVAKVRGALAEGLRVTDEQVRQYYESHKDELRTEEVWLQVIAVEEQAQAEEIQAALRKGEDFGRLARKRSVGLRAARSGDVGWVTAETLWPPMRDAVATLKPGEAIGPLPKGEEFLIVRLHERRPGRTKTLAEARPEIEQRLLAARQREAIEAWLAEREAESKVEIVAPSSTRAVRPPSVKKYPASLGSKTPMAPSGDAAGR